MQPTSTLSAFKEELDSMVGGHIVDEAYLEPYEEDYSLDDVDKDGFDDDWDESEEEID